MNLIKRIINRLLTMCSLKVYEKDPSTWVGELGGKIVTTIELYDDDEGDVWINSASTEEAFQGRGYGSQVVEKIVEAHGRVYASSADKSEHENDPGDIRYLSTEGARLVQSCIRKGIMDKDWYFNPFQTNYDYEDNPHEENHDEVQQDLSDEEFEKMKENIKKIEDSGPLDLFNVDGNA
ncbi:MAG: GNAT family N-acetyltransferase [Bacteroidales bacterium]|nr:GNAT family N-acetyltransferase [Bacteroidales bacterium]